ncbi:RNA polymerase sigma factor [Hwangdonia lutea]|uniref:Sigma-70 family RNA polymerase sigma factor n=1 Tax=Hwangdonia lutea TaxID=3075823 RepID=A0AA97ENF1_9FLAO|nr:sigma-70 family RNA polymerase sigma factor [Hwangdonia sp. SCSIO 19198]WOD44151.1 sigma-70 family RNA polymerase sigma factor [Hwangdonia sp. SCSIO 19198]
MGQAYRLEHQIQLLDAIKSNNSIALKGLYIANYPKVEALVLKNSGTVAHAKDIYQEAFITVWQHVKNDKFVPQNDTALQGYLYRIAKNKWIDVLRSKAFKNSKLLNIEALKVIKNDDIENDDFEDKKLKITMDAFKNLGEPCKSLLRQFYFDKKSMQDIANELKLDPASTRNKKYRCVKKLRELALKINI